MSAPGLETIGEVEGEDIFDVEEEELLAASALKRHASNSSGQVHGETYHSSTPALHPSAQAVHLSHVHGGSGSDSEPEELPQDGSGRPGSADMQGCLQASGSARSSTINASLEDSVLAAIDDTGGSVRSSSSRAIPSTPCRAPSGRAGVTQSLPVTSHVRMGSSVPISIPFMGARPAAFAHRRTVDDEGSDAEDFSLAANGGGNWGTFIPPHKLSQREPNMFSLMDGDSPAVAAKRAKLRQRNIILQKTGFLEPGSNRLGRTSSTGATIATVIAGAAATPPTLLNGLGSSPAMGSGGLSKSLAAGGLSKALFKS